MTLQQFIFTTHPFKRYYRHVVFWTARFIFLMSAAWMNTHLTTDAPSRRLSP